MDSKIDGENADILKIDTEARNRIKWAWLNKSKDFSGDFPSDYVLKSSFCGKALCSWCQTFINYGEGGKKCLFQHAKSDAHKKSR
jgi:hypothetical protein